MSFDYPKGEEKHSPHLAKLEENVSAAYLNESGRPKEAVKAYPGEADTTFDFTLGKNNITSFSAGLCESVFGVSSYAALEGEDRGKKIAWMNHLVYRVAKDFDLDMNQMQKGERFRIYFPPGGGVAQLSMWKKNSAGVERQILNSRPIAEGVVQDTIAKLGDQRAHVDAYNEAYPGAKKRIIDIATSEKKLILWSALEALNQETSLEERQKILQGLDDVDESGESKSGPDFLSIDGINKYLRLHFEVKEKLSGEALDKAMAKHRVKEDGTGYNGSEEQNAAWVRFIRYDWYGFDDSPFSEVELRAAEEKETYRLEVPAAPDEVEEIDFSAPGDDDPTIEGGKILDPAPGMTAAIEDVDLMDHLDPEKKLTEILEGKDLEERAASLNALTRDFLGAGREHQDAMGTYEESLGEYNSLLEEFVAKPGFFGKKKKRERLVALREELVVSREGIISDRETFRLVGKALDGKLVALEKEMSLPSSKLTEARANMDEAAEIMVALDTFVKESKEPAEIPTFDELAAKPEEEVEAKEKEKKPNKAELEAMQIDALDVDGLEEQVNNAGGLTLERFGGEEDRGKLVSVDFDLLKGEITFERGKWRVPYDLAVQFNRPLIEAGVKDMNTSGVLAIDGKRNEPIPLDKERLFGLLESDIRRALEPAEVEPEPEPEPEPVVVEEPKETKPTRAERLDAREQGQIEAFLEAGNLKRLQVEMAALVMDGEYGAALETFGLKFGKEGINFEGREWHVPFTWEVVLKSGDSLTGDEILSVPGSRANPINAGAEDFVELFRGDIEDALPRRGEQEKAEEPVVVGAPEAEKPKPEPVVEEVAAAVPEEEKVWKRYGISKKRYQEQKKKMNRTWSELHLGLNRERGPILNMVEDVPSVEFLSAESVLDEDNPYEKTLVFKHDNGEKRTLKITISDPSGLPKGAALDEWDYNDGGVRVECEETGQRYVYGVSDAVRRILEDMEGL